MEINAAVQSLRDGLRGLLGIDIQAQAEAENREIVEAGQQEVTSLRIQASMTPDADRTKNRWLVQIASAGPTKKGIYFPPEVLERDAAKFKGKHMMVFGVGPNGMPGHMKGELREKVHAAGGAFENSVAVFEDSWWEPAPAGEHKKGAIMAFAVVHDPRQNESLHYLFERGLIQSVELSLDSEHNFARLGPHGLELDRIVDPDSVDIVVKGAAGGKFLRLAAAEEEEGKMENLIAALRQLAVKKGLMNIGKADAGKIVAALQLQETDEEVLSKLEAILSAIQAEKHDAAIALVNEWIAALTKAEAEMMSAEEKKAAEAKAQQMEVEKAKGDKKADLQMSDDVRKEIDGLKSELGKVRQEERDKALQIRLQMSLLPESGKQAVKSMFQGKPWTSEEFEKAQTGLLRMLDESAVRTGAQAEGFGGDIETGAGPMDKVGAATALMFRPFEKGKDPDFWKDVRPFEGIQEVARHCGIVWNRGAQMYFDPKASPIVSLQMELETGDFATLLGNAFNRALIRSFEEIPQWWRMLVRIKSLRDFRTRNFRARFGIQDLPVKTQASNFIEIAGADEPVELATGPSYAPVIRGIRLAMTREAIKNDDIDVQSDTVRKLGIAAGRTILRDVINCFIGNKSLGGTFNSDVFHDGEAVYNDNGVTIAGTHANYSPVDADSPSAMDALLRLMENQAERLAAGVATDAISGFYEPTHILAASTRYRRVRQLFTASVEDGEANDIENRLTGDIRPENIHKVPRELFLAKPNAVIVIADPRQADTVEVGFVDGVETPQILLQDMPVVDRVFTSGSITYRVSAEYNCALVDEKSVAAAYAP